MMGQTKVQKRGNARVLHPRAPMTVCVAPRLSLAQRGSAAGDNDRRFAAWWNAAGILCPVQEWEREGPCPSHLYFHPNFPVPMGRR